MGPTMGRGYPTHQPAGEAETVRKGFRLRLQIAKGCLCHLTQQQTSVTPLILNDHLGCKRLLWRLQIRSGRIP